MNLNASDGVPLLYDPTTFPSRFAQDMWDKLDHTRQVIEVFVQPAKSWMASVDLITVAFVAGLIGFAACVYALTRTSKGNGEMKQATVSDIFLEAVDLAYIKGQVTRTERRRLYKQLAEFFKANDLLNKKQSQAKIKGLIRSRLGSLVHQKKPDIPGEQPFSIEKIKEKQVKAPERNRLTVRRTVLRTQPV